MTETPSPETRIDEAIRTLETTGLPVTTEAVRRLAGVNQNTAAAQVKEWKARRQAHPVPPATRVEQLAAQILSAADAAARADVEAEMASLRSLKDQALQAVEDARAKAEADVTAERQKTKEAHDAITDAEKQIIRLHQQIDAMREQMAVVAAQADAAQKRITDLQSALDVERARVNDLIATISSKPTTNRKTTS